MTEQHLPGIRPTTLATYLAGLGLVRAISRQADPRLRVRWDADHLVVNTSIHSIGEWLVAAYRPAPIVSPWNGGSGFGAKDKGSKLALDTVRAARSERVRDLVDAIVLASTIAGRATDQGWDKERLVTEVRNQCPEGLIPWIDAAVILRGDGVAFPPLLGTGGNDGRLDFSTNYHQRLLEVIPELGGLESQSRGWAEDLLLGTSTTPLAHGAVGQFDAQGAGGPNSSPRGSAESQVNPWQFILLLEGATCFAAGISRRAGTSQTRAAMPFCVYASPEGPRPGTPYESSRGEVWAPVWTTPMLASEVDQLFIESRTSWRGRTVTLASQMYLAVRSLGVARGIDRFVRYGLHQRNGLAFSAVLLDEVDVHPTPDIRLIIEPEAAMRPVSRVSSVPVRQASRRFDRSLVSFARTIRAQHLRDMLAEQTTADLLILRSGRSREEFPRRRPLPSARDYAAYLHQHLAAGAEFRVAAALASVAYRSQLEGVHPIRDLLVGRMPMRAGELWANAAVRGLDLKPVATAVAESVSWRARQPLISKETDHGFVPFSYGVTAHWQDVHAWVQGKLDEEDLRRSFLACLALDWRRVPAPWQYVRPELTVLPDPTLAILQAFAGADLLTSLRGDLGDVLSPRYGVQRSWPSRLLAGRGQAVLDEAAKLLRRDGWNCAAPMFILTSDSEHLLAALAVRPSLRPLRLLGFTAQPKSSSSITQPA